MEPEEWERLADAFAAETRVELSGIEQTYFPDPPGGSFRPFWAQVKDLNERVRTAPAVKLDDKLELQRRLNELCQRARQSQKRLKEERDILDRELRDALDLAAQNLAEATTVEETQGVRSDLAVLRERVVNAARQHPGHRNERIWQLWQDANQAAWTRLNELWASNELELVAMLDAADEQLEAGDVRAAKESVKRFHAETSLRECSHRSLRSLRARAAALWQRANEVGREKHQRYIEHAGKRVRQWRSARDRQLRVRGELEQEIDFLERQAATASTDVGAALIRGQLEDRRRALSRMDSEARDLERRIEEAEVVLRAD